MDKRIVVIGGNAAGINAAVAARRTDRKAEIIMVERDKYAVYSRCGIPFVIAGEIPRFEDLVLYPPEYYKMTKIDLRLETTATAINKDEKTVELLSKDGKSETIEYDSLVLCTGAKAWMPPIEGRDKKGVFMVRTLDDGKAIKEALEKAKNAVVIGAGAIGLEMAAAMKEKGLNVTVVELLPYVLPAALDGDTAKLVQEKLEEEGVRVIVGKGVEAIVGDEKVKGVMVAGEEIPADIVIGATGVRADVELAKNAGIEIGPRRGIKTDFRMRTNVENIYAAGDCAENVHMITKQPAVAQLGTTAVRMGKIAGINAAGGYATFPGVLGSFVTRIFDLQVGATGLTEFMAKRSGMNVVTASLSGITRAEYYPGHKSIRVKLVFDAETRRLIGGQIVGGEEVTQRINVLSVAIQAGFTVTDIMKMDSCYAPPLADVWEPIALTAEIALKKFK